MPSRHSKVRRIDPPVSRFRLEIRPSSIAGKGVFAREVIPRRRLVIEYAGDRITRKELLRRFRMRGKPKRICFARLSRYWFIDGWNGNGSEFINHCCAPNLYATKLRGHFLFFSRRRIRPGEELSFDYKLNPSRKPVPCNCGSPRCRGVMNRLVSKRHRPRRRR